MTHVWQSGRLITIMWTPRPTDTFQVIFIVSLSLVLLNFGSVTYHGSHTYFLFKFVDVIQTFHVHCSGIGDLFSCGASSIQRSEDLPESEGDSDDGPILTMMMMNNEKDPP